MTRNNQQTSLQLRMRKDKILPNGAKVLDFDPDTNIVLAQFRGEFVTWAYNSDDLSTFWGHYHTDIILAVEDFRTRSTA